MLGLLITIVGLGLVVDRGMVDWGISRGMVHSMVNRGMMDSMVNWGMVDSVVNGGSMMNSMSTENCERRSWSTSNERDKSNQSKDLKESEKL